MFTSVERRLRSGDVLREFIRSAVIVFVSKRTSSSAMANAPQNLNRELKLLPDTNGTVTLLRAFGTVLPWRREDGLPIAHPLLIYAELLHESEPRALEAAAQIQEKYLAQ